MRAPELLTFGESMISLRASGLIRLGSNFSSSVAGAESNVAIGLSRLGHSAVWVGAVGSDEQGALIMRTLRAENVLILNRVDDSRATGLMMIEQRLGSNSLVSYYRANSAGSQISWSDVEPALTADVRILHLTGVTPALSELAHDAVLKAAKKSRELGVTVSFDVNYRSLLWSKGQAAKTLGPLAALADILISSEDELALLGNGTEAAIVKRVLSGNTSTVVIKRGAKGVTLITASQTIDVPAHRVRVVDTVGAGDAFCTGFLSGVLDDIGLEAASRRGVLTSAFNVSSLGDWEGLPNRNELKLITLEAGGALR